MQNVVVNEPYIPVPPHRGRIWPAILSHFFARMLRKKYGVTKVECINTFRLHASIQAGHGVMLTPNHCRDEDPLILGTLAKQVRSPLFIMASWHLFKQDRMQAFILRRAGAFSIYREGIDRSAVNTAVEILEKAERPLVIFPEGLISRTNDRLNHLMDGTALIARTAAKKRAKLQTPGKIVIHPVAIRYKFNGDIQKVVSDVLDEIEARLTWRKQPALPPVDRIYRTGGALLALKELDYLGRTQDGDVASRLSSLIEGILLPLEIEWLDGKQEGDPPARVKKLRAAIVPDLTKDELEEVERDRRLMQLDDLAMAQQIHHYPPDYVRSNPSPERLLETIERFEETITGNVRVHGPITATVTVGEAIEASPTREGRSGEDPMMEQVESQLTSMLGLRGEM